MSDRNDEKNRLWNEVFSKKRTYEEKDDSNIELTIEAPKKESAPSTTDTILKTADKAMHELNRILTKQHIRFICIISATAFGNGIIPRAITIPLIWRLCSTVSPLLRSS